MRDYVEKTLHTKVESKPVEVSALPLYLRGLYSLEQWTAFGVPLIMAFPRENQAVKTMAKHRDALEKSLKIPVAFALDNPTSYRAERMLEEGLPFIALGKQIYLPFLGVALSKESRCANSKRPTVAETLSPQAQRLALMMLYDDLYGVSVTQAANLLGAAKMTASRAFDELEAAAPSLVTVEGRRRILHPGKDKRALWQQLEPYLTNPIAREYRLNRMPEAILPLGGISALCELSMLQDNPWPTLAATKEQERTLELTAANLVDPMEPDDPACVVQVMRYEPATTVEHAIDPLSAILSLSDHERDDPRVAGEVENVINQVLGGADEGNR
ncbi:MULTISPECIES: hypothetical protein [Coriobacteriia]|uniref:hypothetical protein n=1 Tax=Coriobacteriia TaxID=84998 RepID=UPI003A984B43